MAVADLSGRWFRGLAIAGALLAAGVVVLGAWVTRAKRRELKRAAAFVLFAVILQISLGIALVNYGLPLPVATLHNLGAAVLVVSMVTLLRALTPRARRADPYIIAPLPA